MPEPDAFREPSPTFEQPDGVPTFTDEPTMPLNNPGASHTSQSMGESSYQASAGEDYTLPIVDLYQPSEPGPGMSPYGTGGDQWNSGYGAAQQQQGGYPGQSPYPVVQPPQQQGDWGPGQYRMVPQEHPQATTVLVLGAVSIAVPVLSFVAWYMGNKAKAEIGRGAPFPYAGNLKAGHIIGKVMGILTIVGAGLYGLFMVFYLILMIGLFTM